MAELASAEIGLLASFNLSRGQKRVVMDAWKDAPGGLIEVAEECRDYGHANGTTGAGLLMHRIARGEHFDAELAQLRGQDDTRKITGWRWVRGTHGESWVRDTKGKDVPARGWQAG